MLISEKSSCALIQYSAPQILAQLNFTCESIDLFNYKSRNHKDGQKERKDLNTGRFKIITRSLIILSRVCAAVVLCFTKHCYHFEFFLAKHSAF